MAAYPGADIGSDHNPLIGTLEFRGKLVAARRKSKTYNILALSDTGKREQLRDELNRNIKPENNAEGSVEDQWKNIKNDILAATEKILGYKKREPKKEWITTEILDMMEERRLAKGNTQKYNLIHRKIRRRIKEAKNVWNQCREELHAKHDAFNFHKKLKMITNTFRKTNISKITKNNKIIIDPQDICNILEEYIQELFENIRAVAPKDIPNNASGPPILESEVTYAFSTLRNRKSPGKDNIHAEVLKLINTKKLCQCFNVFYNTGNISVDWLTSTFVAVPKEPNARACEEHRLINLMSHALKVLLKIIHKRIYSKCEEKSGETHNQFGFKNNLGTREALYCMQLLVQKCYDQRKDVFICFIDYQKAFDNIRHD